MEKCACKGAFLDRLIQPSVLMLLYGEPMHGFSLYKTLAESEIMDYSGIDPTGLYRTLKKMEEAGLLLSRWDTSAQPRRVYTITEDGQHCLKHWRETLGSYQKSIENLASAISQRIGEDE